MTADYKQYLFDLILIDISVKGLSLRKAMVDRMSSQTFFHLISIDKDKAQQYAQACAQRADLMFEEMIDIADETSHDTYVDNDVEKVNQEAIQRSRLRVDTRKWALSKMNPKKYGDKISVDTTVKTIGADASDESYV